MFYQLSNPGRNSGALSQSSSGTPSTESQEPGSCQKSDWHEKGSKRVEKNLKQWVYIYVYLIQSKRVDICVCIPD